jgi:hypothetical protein
VVVVVVHHQLLQQRKQPASLEDKVLQVPVAQVHLMQEVVEEVLEQLELLLVVLQLVVDLVVLERRSHHSPDQYFLLKCLHLG